MKYLERELNHELEHNPHHLLKVVIEWMKIGANGKCDSDYLNSLSQEELDYLHRFATTVVGTMLPTADEIDPDSVVPLHSAVVASVEAAAMDELNIFYY